MALALRSPELVADLVAVDNAPIDAILSRDFAKYVQGMKRIQDANVTRQSEADKILEEYEKVGFNLPVKMVNIAYFMRILADKPLRSHCL